MNEAHGGCMGKVIIKKADFFDYSDGGSIALGIAIRHPNVVGKLITHCHF